MHQSCFVWTPTPPVAGRRTPRPGPVRVCVCSSFLAGSGGPASRARFGAPPSFLWSLCLSALLGLLRAGIPPFLVGCLPSPCCPSPGPPPPFVFFRAPFVSCFLWLLALAALGLGAFFSFLPPPRPLFFFCTPFVCGFLWCPAPGAPGLGAVCCLFCSPPASRLFVPSFPVGCSLVVVAPPPSPPFVSRGFRRCLSLLGFFFPLVSGPWCPRPWCCGLFVLLASRFSAPCALFLCVSRLAVGRSLVVAAPPPPPRAFCRAVFVAAVGCSFFSFPLLRSSPPLSLSPLSLAFSGFGPRCPGLWRCVLFFLVASRFSARCVLSARLCFPPGCRLLHVGCCCATPSFVSRGFCRCLSVLGFFCFAPLLSLAFAGCRPPGALGLDAVGCWFFFCLTLLSSLCALASFVFAAWPWAAPWCLLPPPPLPLLCLAVFAAASRRSVFFFVVRPRCLCLFPVSGPGCPVPGRCVLFVPRAAGCGVLCFASSYVVSRFLRSVVRFVLCLVLCGVLVSGWVLAPCCVGSCCAVFVVLCCLALLRSLPVSFVVPCLSVVLRAVSVPVLCLCDAVPVCLRRCSLCVAFLPRQALAGGLCCCLLYLRVCCWAWLSSVVSWWVLVGPGVVFRWGATVCPWVLCCPVLLAVVPPGVVLLCAVFFRFALRGAVAHCGVSWGAVLRPVVLCLRRCVLSCLAALCAFLLCCVAAWCCSPLCLVLCASWGVVLCVPCPLRPVRCWCASLLSLGALLPCVVFHGAMLPCGVVVSCPAAVFVWFLLLVQLLQNLFQ